MSAVAQRSRGSADPEAAPAPFGGHVTKAYRYDMFVSWSDEDGIFVVDVPDLPGCTAHGATPALAVTNAQDAISLWLEVARDEGRAIPEPRGRGVSST